MYLIFIYIVISNCFNFPCPISIVEFFYKLFIDKTSNLLKLLGVNINTVPVLDLRIKGKSNVIGDRSFSHNPKIVSKIGDYCIEFFRENGIGTVIKHIPGHGLTSKDSHLSLPTVSSSLKILQNQLKLFHHFRHLPYAMTAHIKYDKWDKDDMATYSKKIIQMLKRIIL